MVKEKISQQFRLKDIDEIKNHLIEQINQNDLIGIKKSV